MSDLQHDPPNKAETTPIYQPDAATAALLKRMAESNAPSYADYTPEEARAAMLQAGKIADIEPPHIEQVADMTIPGPAGEIAVRIYEPNPEAGGMGLRPCCLFFHGGGFVIGDLNSHDTIARSMAIGGDCMVVAVDYRLAPEHPYPAAVEDALAAWNWLVAEGGTINVDTTRLAVCGDSAGATLSAIITQTARDAGTPLRAQVLYYPLLDMAGDYPSYHEHAETPPISKEVLAYFWKHYLGPDADDLDMSHPWLSPIRAQSLEQLPPAFIMTSGLDPLRDEGKAYADALAQAGGHVVYHCEAGTIHGVLRMGKLIPAVKSILDAGSKFLRTHIH
ncbi:MAG: alpha/beta hydrolase [Pseudomonadota bacterium]